MDKKIIFSTLFFVTLFIGCGAEHTTTEDNEAQKVTKKIDEVKIVKVPTKQNNAAITLPNLTNSHMPTDNLDVK